MACICRKVNIKSTYSNRAAPITIFTRGDKLFELSNHLGNVLATVSDKKIQHTTDGVTIDFYNPEVVTANDYYPGGMMMPGRSYQANATSKYRYSINGQEKESLLNDNITTAEYWEYDSRIGKRWNLDPVVNPGQSPYLTFGGNPIANIDPNGADTINFTRNTTIRKSGTMKSNLDNYSSKKIPDLITSTASIDIKAAKGLDIFRLIDNTTTIDEDGNSTTTSNTTTLDIRGERSDYRNGGHNVKGFIDDRYALASIAPTSLLKSYAAKNKNYDSPTEWGLGAAMAYQSDVPFCAALQKITNYTYAIVGAYGIARMTLVAALPASAGETSFFAGTRYTSKVFKQMNMGDFHGFPEGVKAFERYGIRSVIKGADGVERQMLRIPGQYGNKSGFFEFMKEADGSINHRLFNPNL